MALDFTVVITVRQRFGDTRDDDTGEETDAPFVGSEKEFNFRCPNVDRSQQAILLFQCQGANIQQSMEINGQQVFGGIPSSVELVTNPVTSQILVRALWNGNVMLIQEGVLQENNVLRIQASAIPDSDGNIDNFIIDNLVVIFKTRPGLRVPGGALTAEESAAPRHDPPI